MSDYKQKLELLWRFDGKMTLDHMGLLVHYMTHQGDSWVFTARNVCNYLGIGIEKYLKLKKDLQEAMVLVEEVHQAAELKVAWEALKEWAVAVILM